MALNTENKYSWKISVIKHRSRRQAWDIFIIIIALYSVLVIPIRIGINVKLWDPAYDFIDVITWLFYCFDMFINLRTTYVDSFGMEVVESKRIMLKYVGSIRFVLDILSLLNMPSILTKGFSTRIQVVLNILGLLKLSRYFRASTLIVQSRLQKDQKAKMSCGFFFVLLLIYLHMIGCMFFFFCLSTYEVSSTRLGILEGMGARLPNIDGSYNYPISWIEEVAIIAEDGYKARGNDALVYAWVPAFDNYDGTEMFWRHYELSTLNEDEKVILMENGGINPNEVGNTEWFYVWSVCIYYSVLVIGGNEMQPA